MAAIASTLQADFSEFVAETMKANAAMKAMQAEAHGVSTAVAGTASDLDQVGGAATASTAGVNKLSTSLRTADKTLGAFGVQMGPQIAALEEMEQLERDGDLGPIALVDVVAEPELSQLVAERVGVRHQSPQLLYLEEGVVRWHVSHGSITADAVRRRLSGAPDRV